MESCGDEENTNSDVIENLMNMFGEVMSKEVISAVVESCEGDLNLSVDAIMNMTSDGNVITEDEQPSTSNQNISLETASAIQPPMSFASVSAIQPTQSTGAIPKTIQKPVQHTEGFWSDQVKNIIAHHKKGHRVMIFMRGMPGSGKTFLAEHIMENMMGPNLPNYKAHVFSTDDYFMIAGQYQYEKYRLSEAHSWNQSRCRNACKMGVSPVIIDNTNIELWEMEPYLRNGVSCGYIIEVIEPKTPWAKKANQLAKRNLHNVPIITIKRKLETYREGITGEILIQTYALRYPANMIPPVKRNMPPITKESDSKPDSTAEEHTNASTSQTVSTNQFFQSATSTLNNQTQQIRISNNPNRQTDVDVVKPNESAEKEQKHFFRNNEQDDLTTEELEKLKFYIEAQKKLEEIEEVEKEWDNGENWEDDQEAVKESVVLKVTSNISTDKSNLTTAAKPQRKHNLSSPPLSPSLRSAEVLMQNVNDCQDWSKISMFMPPWNDASESSTSVSNQVVPVDMKSSSTCIELGDVDVDGKFKILIATPRNINQFHISFDHEKIPQKRMLDKSSMTNEGMIINAFRCPNEEKHFIAFRKLFKNIARSDLRDIFDKCCGDVNWSVEIVLDGMNNNQFKTIETEEQSDPEDETIEQCACLANYNIIPDVGSPHTIETPPPIDNKVSSVPLNGSQTQKKKRDVAMSDESINIKRQIEQNVVIADNHYSKHCLKIRKFRRGELDVSENNPEELGATALSPDAVPFEPKYPNYNLDGYDDEDCSNASDIDDDVMVTINIGESFIAELDEKFGRKDMQYPGYVVPKISVPMSLLNEFNALWMESLTFQLDDHAKKTAAMMHQDEELARQIAMKEAELSLAGKEPEVPDFKEIMDMDMALAIYQKDLAEWRNNMPTDLAAKMTRDKLFNLFPDVSQDTLTELLMAHDNNFNATVEVLLMSTGRSDIVEQENGINKFVSSEEMKLKEKIMEEQKRELSEAEWPLLSKGEKVDMATVQAYREEADNHLARRNLNQQKAQDYIRRGMTQVANYYSELANFHKQKYEYANGLAVASLMQFHATNNPDCTTIDLHYLRVKEAKESLDVFIDSHISKLRDAGRRNQMLFFITGRGSHSQGRARIKPATIERLKQRGLLYSFKNPGLLAAKVNSNTKLTYQISVP